MGIVEIVVIGFIAGLIARWLAPGEKKPTGFILTTILGIAGAFVATYLGQAIGWYRADQGAAATAELRPSPVNFERVRSPTDLPPYDAQSEIL